MFSPTKSPFSSCPLSSATFIFQLHPFNSRFQDLFHCPWLVLHAIMEGKYVIESPVAVARRQPMVTYAPTSPRIKVKDRGHRSRMGEAAGGCMAICCCCPCAAIHFFILGVYLLPAKLWRRKKRRRLLKKSRKILSDEEGFDHRKGNTNSRIPMSMFGFYGDEYRWSSDGEDDSSRNDAVDWDNEMWDQFPGAGFWRSDSQRKWSISRNMCQFQEGSKLESYK